jgi:PAS domain S-box-containing protein
MRQTDRVHGSRRSRAAEVENALLSARQEALRLRGILDRGPDAFISTDAAGRVRGWNSVAGRLFGWSAAEAAGRPAGELILSSRARYEYGECLHRMREGAAGNSPGVRLELTAVDRTGREFPVEMALRTDVEGGEQVCRMFVHDIGDRRRAETLRDVRYAVAQVLAEAVSAEQAAAGVIAAVADVLDWTCGEYWQVGSDVGITRIGSWVRPGRDLSAFTGYRPVTFRPGQGVPGMVWVTGRRMWFSDLTADPQEFSRKQAALRCGLRAVVGLPVRSGHRVLGVLVFCADAVQQPDDDLTALLDGVCACIGRYMERRRAEELALALAADRRQFNQIVTHVSEDVWTIEIVSEDKARLVYASSLGASVLGEELPPDIGDDLVDYISRHVHPDDAADFSAFCATLAAGRPAMVEFRALGRDGVTRWIWARGMPRREGDLLFVDGISTDVTERHRMAEERERLLAQEQRQVRHLQELDRMKDELMAVVSHELRNPIGAIRGYTEMLLDDPDLTGEGRSFADVIDRKSEQLQRLTDDLLDLARLDSGHVSVEPRRVSLTPLVHQAVQDHGPAADAKRLTVTADVADELPVHADPVRLRQVLDNLLSNAIKYTPHDGTVAVTARRDDDGCQVVVVTVADTGIGIPVEEYPQLFTRFFRASTAKDAGTKGTGLGLAVTKAIVDAHGGSINACPRENGGTVFTVRLPAADPEPEDPGGPDPGQG